ncbi:hypothetical protein [Sorangium sp. So ce1097]|uniref:hypothetical protein n=1 Tax=Sorangium sp. So ce1097 TaxID=3133330 RepID=UPI003F5FCB42
MENLTDRLCAARPACCPAPWGSSAWRRWAAETAAAAAARAAHAEALDPEAVELLLARARHRADSRARSMSHVLQRTALFACAGAVLLAGCGSSSPAPLQAEVSSTGEGGRSGGCRAALFGSVLVVIYRLAVTERRLLPAQDGSRAATAQPPARRPTTFRAVLDALFSTPALVCIYVGSGLALFIMGPRWPGCPAT